MTSPGQYGSHQYQSPETRALASITAESYDKDQAKTLIKLKNDVGYMAAYMRKMQKSIDQANENFIQQIQSFIADFVSLLGGASLTSIDFGDLRYVLQAIGALFGFQSAGGIPIPINLFTAVWNFFGIYLAPTQQFADVINELIDAGVALIIDAFGDIPIFGQAIEQLAGWLIEIRDALWPLIDTFFLLIDTLSGQPGTEAADVMFGLFNQIIEILLTTPDVLINVLHSLIDLLIDIPEILLALLNGLIGLLVSVPDIIITLLDELVNQLLIIPDMLEQLLTGLIEMLIEIPNMLGDLLLSLINLLVAIPEILATLTIGLIELVIETPEILLNLGAAILGLIVKTPEILARLAAALVEGAFGLLGALSPLNALNLFNIIPQGLLGFLPFSAVGQGNPNLLANPSFDGAVSVQGGKMWLWDSAVGHTTNGSVYCTGNGQLKQLRSNSIPVSIGQQLAISVWSKWNGLTYAGTTTPIKLQIVRFLENAEIGTDELIAPLSPTATQAAWTLISENYSAPGGCDSICLQIVVASNVTAGTVRFDDGDVRKTGSSATIVPAENVFGVGGPLNMVGSIFGIFNSIVGGLVGSITGSGAGLADVSAMSEEISSRASKGMYSWEVLGIRNNKPIDQGLMATSNSNFSLGRVAMNASAPTIPVTQAASVMAFTRMQESNDKGVLSWLGYGNANITGCFVNIWQMNTLTGDLTLVHRSPNLVGALSGGSTPAWVIYDYPDDMLLTHAGELYGIEITIVGSGTHTVAGTTTWLPPHPTTFPKSYAATRNSGTGTPAIGTVIPNASVVYATNIPWVEWGIIVEADFGSHPDQITQFTEAGDGTLPVPDWANYVDIIVLGGGGPGGLGGYFGSPGWNGGAAGEWATATWERGVEFTGATVLDITVGAGGPYGADGEDSVVSIPGHSVIGAGGGYMAGPGQYGEGAGNQEYLGLTYVGGADSWGYGAVPGGGGVSGNDFISGAGFDGARGGVWTVFRENE